MRILWVLALLPVLLTNCQVYHQPQEGQTQLYRMNDQQTAATPAEITAMIRPYKQKLDQKMDEVIAQVTEPMPKQRPESTLGNWVADLSLVKAQQYTNEPVDIALQNYGGLRIPELPAGPLTVRRVYELMPFDNMLVVVAMNGKTLQQLCDQVAKDGGWPVSQGLRFTISNGAKDVRINGMPLVADRTYRVALPDYIANGGGDCDFLVDCSQTNTNRLVRDLIIEYAREQTQAGQVIQSQLEGRITVNL